MQAHEIVVGQTHGLAGFVAGSFRLAPAHECGEVLLAPAAHPAQCSQLVHPSRVRSRSRVNGRLPAPRGHAPGLAAVSSEGYGRNKVNGLTPRIVARSSAQPEDRGTPWRLEHSVLATAL